MDANKARCSLGEMCDVSCVYSVSESWGEWYVLFINVLPLASLRLCVTQGSGKMQLGLTFSDSDVSSFTPLVVLELAYDTKAEAITWLLNRIRDKQQNGGETPGMLHLGIEVDRNWTFSEIYTCVLKLSVFEVRSLSFGPLSVLLNHCDPPNVNPALRRGHGHRISDSACRGKIHASLKLLHSYCLHRHLVLIKTNNSVSY